MQVAIAHSVVTAPAHAAAIEKWSSAETCCFGIIGGKAPFIDRRHEPLCFRGGIRLLSPQVDTHELPLLCGAVPADPLVCVSLSLSLSLSLAPTPSLGQERLYWLALVF